MANVKKNPEEIKAFIESYGCKMLSEYKSANAELEISCNCGAVRKTNFTNFKYSKNKICSLCAKKQTAQKRKFSFNAVKEFVEKTRCKLLSTEYKNANTPMLLQCRCGNKWNVDFNIFKRSKHKACKVCSAAEGGKLLSGENSNFFGKNGKLNANFNNKANKKKFAKKFRSPEYVTIREKILQRDNYTCKKCGFVAKFKKEKNSLNVHHLFNKAQYPKWFFKIFNLLTLCGECHVNFHKAFGFRNNTPKQMKIYLKETK